MAPRSGEGAIRALPISTKRDTCSAATVPYMPAQMPMATSAHQYSKPAVTSESPQAGMRSRERFSTAFCRCPNRNGVRRPTLRWKSSRRFWATSFQSERFSAATGFTSPITACWASELDSRKLRVKIVIDLQREWALSEFASRSGFTIPRNWAAREPAHMKYGWRRCGSIQGIIRSSDDGRCAADAMGLRSTWRNSGVQFSKQDLSHGLVSARRALAASYGGEDNQARIAVPTAEGNNPATPRRPRRSYEHLPRPAASSEDGPNSQDSVQPTLPLRRASDLAIELFKRRRDRNPRILRLRPAAAPRAKANRAASASDNSRTTASANFASSSAISACRPSINGVPERLRDVATIAAPEAIASRILFFTPSPNLSGLA